MTMRQHDLYARTFHLNLDLLAGADAGAPAWRRLIKRLRRALRRVLKSLQAKGVFRPLPIWTDLTPLEESLLTLLCRLSYYRDGQYHGVAFSVRMALAHLGGGLDKAFAALVSLIHKGYLVVLEKSRGRRPQVLMPNPSRAANPTLPPLCSPHGNKKGATPSVAFPPAETQGAPLKENEDKKKAEPPPAFGQGGPAPRATCDPNRFQTALAQIRKNTALVSGKVIKFMNVLGENVGVPPQEAAAQPVVPPAPAEATPEASAPQQKPEQQWQEVTPELLALQHKLEQRRREVNLR